MIADKRDYSLYLTNATIIYNLFRGFVKSFTMKRRIQNISTSTFDDKRIYDVIIIR